MAYRVNMQWRTPIVEVLNPDHARIKPGLVRHAYETEQRAKGPIASGVAPYAKGGLYESLYRHQFVERPERPRLVSGA